MSDRNRKDLLSPGGLARFVRWHQNRDGDWYPEVLHGRYQSATPEGWLVDLDGTPQLLQYNEWSVYRGEHTTDLGRVPRA